MLNRTTKLRLRRRYRRSRLQAQDMGVQAEEGLERHFFKRLNRIWEVRRFVLSWLLLPVLLSTAVVFQTRALSGYYQDLRPIGGGTHSEGLVGSFTNANPVYAVSQVDASVSRLVFAGLLAYNSKNELENDLAESWRVDPEGQLYTIVLRENLRWHDGRPLTADDVVFTFETIQKPDAKSPFYRAWRGVTVKALDARTVTFVLANPHSPFVHGLTAGIIPKHILENVEPAQLRSANFNTNQPIGAGPFRWDTIEIVGNDPESAEQHVGLLASTTYHRGAVQLDRFVIKTYTSQERLENSFANQEVNAMIGLERLPDEFSTDQSVNALEVPLNAETLAFLRTDSDLLKDKKVRQALVRAVNVPEIVNGLGYPVLLADSPLLRGQLSYDPSLRQFGRKVSEANKLLDAAGWKRPAPDQPRQKGNLKLSLKLNGQNTADYNHIAKSLQNAWQAIGVSTEVFLQSPEDLQATIANRTYDVLLSGIAIGPDPDVFVYWHSSQADPRAANRLNLSGYKSEAADAALEAGRSRLDPALRSAKYKPFLRAWREDVPAIALYQPRFLYITRGELYQFDSKRLNNGVDRYANVHNWMVRAGRVPKTVQ